MNEWKKMSNKLPPRWKWVVVKFYSGEVCICYRSLLGYRLVHPSGLTSHFIASKQEWRELQLEEYNQLIEILKDKQK